MLRVGAVLLCLAVLAGAGEAQARCGQMGDFQAVAAGLKAELRCRSGALFGQAVSCASPAYPACAGSMPEEVLELILGPNLEAASPWTSSSRRCQRALVLAGRSFVAERLIERADGRRRARASRAMVKLVERGCRRSTVETDDEGEKLPRVGAPCTALLGSPGEPIDGKRLARCVRAVLEAKVDEIAPAPLRPNILLVLTDDQRSDFVDAMPFVSRLRDESLSFRNGFTTNPVCTPSRASVLTGRYTHNNGVLSNGHFLLLDDSDTIATWLESAGYANGLFGKYLNNAELLGLTPPAGWHEWQSFLHPSGGGFYGFRVNDNGVARTIGSGSYSTDWMRRRVLDFVRSHQDDPFFAVFTPFAPHGPAEPAIRHRKEFLEYPLHRPASFLADVDEKPNWVGYYKLIAEEDFVDEVDEELLLRLQSLLSVDEAVERILGKIEKLGLSDNTVVVFTSDHGFLLGEHWLQGKFNAYEESIRIPYVLRYPRRYPVATEFDQLVLNHDLAPTLAEFAGAEVPPDLDGRSLVPILDSPTAHWRQEFLIETLGEFITRPSQSVRTHRWKFIQTQANDGVLEELYDLESDPYEMTNLASDPAYSWVRADMAARLLFLSGS